MSSGGVVDGSRLEVTHSRRSLKHNTLVSYRGVRGRVRFVGRTRFGPGVYVGVELDQPYGDCNGTVEHVQYFVARERHGVLVKPSALRVLQGLKVRKEAVLLQGSTGRRAVEAIGIPHKIRRAMAERKERKKAKARVRAAAAHAYRPHIRYYDMPKSRVDPNATAAELIDSYSPPRPPRSRPPHAPPHPTSRSDPSSASDVWLGRPGCRAPRLAAVYDPSVQPTRFEIGNRVLTNESRVLFQREGVVKYIGYVEDLKGLWIGVELDAHLPDGIKQLPNFVGPHDGSLAGAFYFDAQPTTGIFVRPSALELQDPNVVAIRAAEARQHELALKYAAESAPAPDSDDDAPDDTIPLAAAAFGSRSTRLSPVSGHTLRPALHDDDASYAYSEYEYEYD